MFDKKIRHINRYRDIVVALNSQGFNFLVDELNIIKKIPYSKRVFPVLVNKPKRSIGERIRLVLQQLGPTFIKLGQIASTRADLLPEDVILELEKLQSKVPSFPYTEVRSIIEDELGATPEDLFYFFETTPLAAASIGQVHKAILHTGEIVAIKVQRPNIKATIETDLEIIRSLASIAEKRFQWASKYQILDIINELAKSLMLELDYTNEAHNAEIIAKQFRDNKEFYIPKIYWNFTTKKVLTAEFISGLQINEIAQLKALGYNLPELAERLVRGILQQIFFEGVFHGDPHPGNIVVLPSQIIGFWDFGMVGRLNEDMKYQLSSLVISLIRDDSIGIVNALLNMGAAPKNVDIHRLKYDIDKLRDKYYGVSLSEISIGHAIRSIFIVAFEHQIKIPSDLTLLAKTLLTVEGIVTKLNPNISIMDIAEPIGKQLVLKRLSPKYLYKNFMKNIHTIGGVLNEAPKLFRSITAILNNERVSIDVSIQELAFLVSTLDRISNRISFSVTLLALSMIMSSIVIGLSLAGQTALFFKLPVVEIGSAIALFMVIWLLYAIIKSGKM